MESWRGMENLFVRQDGKGKHTKIDDKNCENQTMNSLRERIKVRQLWKYMMHGMRVYEALRKISLDDTGELNWEDEDFDSRVTRQKLVQG